MLNDLSAKYYQKNKERFYKRSCERYKDVPDEEKVKRQEYGCK